MDCYQPNHHAHRIHRKEHGKPHPRDPHLTCKLEEIVGIVAPGLELINQENAADSCRLSPGALRILRGPEAVQDDVYQGPMEGSPLPGLFISLTQFQLLRALYANTLTLDLIVELLKQDIFSPFNTVAP
jgi:hypothetical protein